MERTLQSRILLCTSEPSAGEDVRQFLADTGYTVNEHIISSVSNDEFPQEELVIVDAATDRVAACLLVRRLRAHQSECFHPILVLLSDASPSARLACLEAGADGYLLRPFASSELLMQVQSFLRFSEWQCRLGEKTKELQHVNRQLTLAYQQSSQELEIAGRIQRSFPLRTVFDFPPARFAVHQASQGKSGGDRYDVFHLGDNQVGFYLADVMGRGMQASLVSLFLERRLRLQDRFRREDRPTPNEVVKSLNQELLTLSHGELPYISLLYGVLDIRAGCLSLARAGHPCPLFVPHVGDPVWLRVPGSLLGLFETDFPVLRQRFAPGDKLLLYSDGLNSANPEGEAAEPHHLLTSAVRHRSLSIQEFIRQLSVELREQTQPEEDFTMLGMELSA